MVVCVLSDRNDLLSDFGYKPLKTSTFCLGRATKITLQGLVLLTLTGIMRPIVSECMTIFPAHWFMPAILANGMGGVIEGFPFLVF